MSLQNCLSQLSDLQNHSFRPCFPWAHLYHLSSIFQPRLSTSKKQSSKPQTFQQRISKTIQISCLAIRCREPNPKASNASLDWIQRRRLTIDIRLLMDTWALSSNISHSCRLLFKHILCFKVLRTSTSI